MQSIPTLISQGAMDAEDKTKVPASVTISQWALESGWGAHTPGNNPFGMKPRQGMNDPSQLLWTTEFDKKTAKYKQVQQPFRTFPSLAAALIAHAQLLSTAPVYRQAMSKLPDLDKFVQLMAVHYATDPLYYKKIMATIKANNLTRFDK